MPKFYCDYCECYLTHDSPSVRKAHCAGHKHKTSVRLYYEGKFYKFNVIFSCLTTSVEIDQ